MGEGAREQARRARIGELRTELDALEAEREQLAEELGAVAERRGVLDAELAAVPGDDDLRHAHARVTAAADAAHRARTRQDERAAELALAAGNADRAAAELTETAAALNLPTDRTGLGSVRQALADHTACLAALWPALRERAEAEHAVFGEQAETGRAELRVFELAERRTEAARLAAAADERLTTLRSTVGAAVAELQRRLEETEAAVRVCESEQQRAQADFGDADRRASHAEGRIERLAEDVTEATAARERAIVALQRYASTGLLAVALPDVVVPDDEGGTWAATPAVNLARAIESQLSSVDDSDAAWERVQKRLSEEYGRLQDALSRHGHTATARPSEDGMRVDIVYQGRERAVPELADALATEVAELTRILSAHEREILQTHLITEVAGTLQELIGAAERQVRAMNRELEERPTSTGMKLRLVAGVAPGPAGTDTGLVNGCASPPTRGRHRTGPRSARSSRNRSPVGRPTTAPAAGWRISLPPSTTGLGTSSASNVTSTGNGYRPPGPPRAANGSWRRPCLSSPRRPPTTRARAAPTPHAWSLWTRRSPAWTTTRAPSASACCAPSTSTSS